MAIKLILLLNKLLCTIKGHLLLALFYSIVFLIFVFCCLRYVTKGYTLLFKNNSGKSAIDIASEGKK